MIRWAGLLLVAVTVTACGPDAAENKAAEVRARQAADDAAGPKPVDRSPAEQARLEGLLADYRQGRDGESEPGSAKGVFGDNRELAEKRYHAEKILSAEFPAELELEKQAEDLLRKEDAKGRADASFAEEEQRK